MKREYDRASFDGETTDFRTAVLMRLIDKQLQDKRGFPPMNCFQGSYSTDVSASGSTHAGGGVLDIGWPGASQSKHDEGMCFLRNHGFQAGWCRHPGSTGFILHVHTIDVGNQRLSPDAQLQLRNFRHEGDGLWPLVDGDDPFGCRPARVVGWDFDAWKQAQQTVVELRQGVTDLATTQKELRRRLEKVSETKKARLERIQKLQHERLSL